AGMAYNFDAVVLIRIVRSGNHYTGDERARSRQVCNARGGDDASKSVGYADTLEASGDMGREPRPAFPSVHTYQDLGGLMTRITSGRLLRPCSKCDT